MKRLTTDHPQDNIQTKLNMFYEKDGWPWVRGIVDAKGQHDEPLHEIVRRLYAKQYPDSNLLREDDGPCMIILKILVNESVEKAWVFATMFEAAFAACDLREWLKAIEDILGDDYDLEKLKELVEAERDGRLKIGEDPQPPRYGWEEEQREKIAALGG